MPIFHENTEPIESVKINDPSDGLPFLLARDPYLRPYEGILRHRFSYFHELEKRLTQERVSLADFAAGHEYFGLHYRNNEWIFREWAPNAISIYLVGEMSEWREKKAFALERINPEGVWEIHLPPGTFRHGDLYRLRIHWENGQGDRIPAFARRVVQDPGTLIFNAQVWFPPFPYSWKCLEFRCASAPLFIYEAHVGMAQEEEKIGSFREFSEKILPRIVRAGYNTIQLMAIPEHPYYGSFGYHVSNFFAASSRFGTPDDLKALVDRAHQSGLSVIMDLVHSHAARNEVEGLSRFDGTLYQYFHEGPRGFHSAWDSRCFDYGKRQVLHFLLSNCRFWLDEYHFDGFRFDGITSMLYHHHGLGEAFTHYDRYFGSSVDEDALAYLYLANRVIHDVRPDAVTIAEDISGMPGLAAPVSEGCLGFDYRFAMGIPDYWIRIVKHVSDEDWQMGDMWYELTNRRKEEKTISYAESHDQSLVGDQTLIFRLIGSDMYEYMRVSDENLRIDRGIALHKLIRFITLVTAGNGYLNFMGNEFGHPEWIDFPREGNKWSLHYARRQWHLVDDTNLKYQFLARFDRDMIELTKRFRILEFFQPNLLYEHNDDKVLVIERNRLLFVFNFHPTRSHVNYRFEALPGTYRVILDSDHQKYGGHGRLTPDQCHRTLPGTADDSGRHYLSLYLPTRTAIVLTSDSKA